MEGKKALIELKIQSFPGRLHCRVSKTKLRLLETLELRGGDPHEKLNPQPQELCLSSGVQVQ